MLPEDREAIKNHELRQRSFFSALLRRGAAEGEFRAAQENFLAEAIVMLSHTWILKGWALRQEMNFEEFKASVIGLVFSYLDAPLSKDGRKGAGF